MIAKEIKRKKKEYKDVLEPQTNLIDVYESVPPDCLKTNQFNLEEADYQDFLQYHMKIKKELELDTIRQNRKNEINSKVLKLIAPGNNREATKEKYEVLQYLAKKIIRKERILARQKERQEKKKKEKEDKKQAALNKKQKGKLMLFY